MKNLKGFLLRMIYLALACAMFYFTNEDMTIGGIGILYQLLFAIAIIVFAFTIFLVYPDTHRMAITLRYSWRLSAHYFWIELYSMLVWGLSLSRFNIITRGSSFIVYSLIGVLAAAATIYLFGREGVRLMMIALLLANGIYIVEAILDNGAGPFFREYIELIVSFTGKTGPIMKSFESLNYAYMLGFFLLYQILEEIFDYRLRKQGGVCPSMLKQEWWLFLFAGACFLLGLKRSVLLSIIAGFVVGILLLFLHARETKNAAHILCIMLVLFGFAYVIGCYYGVMDWLESIGINTNTRAHFWGQLRPYYEVGIGYLGKGAGYVSRMMQEGNLVQEYRGYLIRDIHNDYLRQYIELGFFGFLIWMLLFLNYKENYFFHDLKTETDRLHGVLAMCFIVANCTTFLTENALYYNKLNMMLSLLVMAYHFEDYYNAEAEYG
ncbi:MAG: O-antigen ligase family protein [Clostridium sp.]|nr:O-antigen ligase family protein [Clostridium sp.]